MHRDKVLEIHTEFTKKAYQLIESKSLDYAGNDDCLSNFRKAERWGVSVSQAIASRLEDKLSRLANIQNNHQINVTDESLDDTVIDAVNYLILYYCSILDASPK